MTDADKLVERLRKVGAVADDSKIDWMIEAICLCREAADWIAAQLTDVTADVLRDCLKESNRLREELERENARLRAEIESHSRNEPVAAQTVPCDQKPQASSSGQSVSAAAPALEMREIAESNAVDFLGQQDRILIVDRLEAILRSTLAAALKAVEQLNLQLQIESESNMIVAGERDELKHRAQEKEKSK